MAVVGLLALSSVGCAAPTTRTATHDVAPETSRALAHLESRIRSEIERLRPYTDDDQVLADAVQYHVTQAWVDAIQAFETEPVPRRVKDAFLEYKLSEQALHRFIVSAILDARGAAAPPGER